MEEKIIHLELVNYGFYAEGEDISNLAEELAWLLPTNSDLSEIKKPDISFIETEIPMGGGGGGFDFGQYVITFINNPEVQAAIVLAFAKIFLKFFSPNSKNSGREVTIKIGDKELKYKGQFDKSLQELMRAIFPEIDATQVTPSKSKIDSPTLKGKFVGKSKRS